VANQRRVTDELKKLFPEIIKTGGFPQVFFGNTAAEFKNTRRDTANGRVDQLLVGLFFFSVYFNSADFDNLVNLTKAGGFQV
jgi:hypothetical protein